MSIQQQIANRLVSMFGTSTSNVIEEHAAVAARSSKVYFGTEVSKDDILEAFYTYPEGEERYIYVDRNMCVQPTTAEAAAQLPSSKDGIIVRSTLGAGSVQYHVLCAETSPEDYSGKLAYIESYVEHDASCGVWFKFEQYVK